MTNVLTFMFVFFKTTEAAAAVVGQERREGYIRARAAHRKKLPKFSSKRDVIKLMESDDKGTCDTEQ